MSQAKITFFILLANSMQHARSILFPSRSLTQFGSNDRYLIGNQGKPFEAECIGEELDLDHPTWVFTRDSWIRSPMDESSGEKKVPIITKVQLCPQFQKGMTRRRQAG